MTGPIRPLVLARARGRGLTTLLLMGAVAAAVALVAIVAWIGAIATDRTLARALATDGAERPVVRISHFSSSAEDREAVSGRVDAVSEALGAHTAPPVRGVLMRELTDLEVPVFELLIAIDEPGPWTTVLEGRLPEPCTPMRCEALLASEVAAPAGLTTARPVKGLDLPIVGRGLLDPAVPFEHLDQSGAAGERPATESQTERRAPAILLVNGVDALARITALDRTGRTYVWTAVLRPEAIHAWTVDDFMARLSSVTRRLTDDDSAFTITGPAGRIDDELGRAEAARGRLLLIGSLAVSILLAFAVFAALVGRTDVMAEAARLRAVGARRRDVTGFLLLEAALPVGVGAALGVVGGVLVVAALAASQDAPVGPLLADALLAPGTLAAAAAVLALAVV
ncbi:MAG: FtsX-like permease family protein, partial [Candidatus Limnocylindria bacterium]